MESTYIDLAERIGALASERLPRRTLVGIAGPPGCGKSTIAQAVVDLINQESTRTRPLNTAITAKAVGLDGFHYYRSQLDLFENPEEAHLRRGSPFTFDVNSIFDLVQQLHKSAQNPPNQRSEVHAPSFDHALKDPVQNDILIEPYIPVVILDGNYLLLDEPRWKDIAALLDLKIFVQVESVVARERVTHRHVLSGIEPDLGKAQVRFDSNDALNGELIRNKAIPCDLVVHSICA